jgi:phage shock protein PspC (stress-responsive transcriptional regulator)
MSEPPPAPPRPSPSDHRVGASGLVREPSDRKLAGVCSGLADRLGVDVTALRVGAVLLALVTPVTVIAYVVAALVLPERRPDQPRVRAQRVHLGRIPHPVLVVAAIIAVAVIVDDAWWLAPFPAAVALIAVGVWLIVQGRDDGADGRDGLPWPTPQAPDVAVSQHTDAEGVNGTTFESAPQDADTTEPLDGTERFSPAEGTGPSGEFPPPASPWWSGRPGQEEFGADPDEPLAAPLAPPPVAPVVVSPPRPRPPRSRLGAVVLALLLVGGGFMWLLDTVDLVDVDWPDRLALALVTVGLGLLVAAWWGRAWALVPIGLLLALLLVTAEALVVPVDAGTGEQTVIVDTASELARDHELFAGQLTLDLRQAELSTERTTTLTGEVGAGQLRVLLPQGTTATVDAEVRIGDIASDGGDDANESGVGLDETFTLTGADGGPEVELDLFVGFGSLEVTRG